MSVSTLQELSCDQSFLGHLWPTERRSNVSSRWWRQKSLWEMPSSSGRCWKSSQRLKPSWATLQHFPEEHSWLCSLEEPIMSSSERPPDLTISHMSLSWWLVRLGLFIRMSSKQRVNNGRHHWWMLLRWTLMREKIPVVGEFTIRSDPWAGLIASCGSFYPMVPAHIHFLSLSWAATVFS